MTRKQVKNIFQNYKVYEVELQNYQIDIDYANELGESDKIPQYEDAKNKCLEKLNCICKFIRILNVVEQQILDCFISNQGVKYSEDAIRLTGMSEHIIYWIMTGIIEKAIPFLEPVFNE